MNKNLIPIYLITLTVSLFVIILQVALMQYFAYLQWYHFASMVISFCLIGFGFSGLIIHFTRKYSPLNSDETLLWLLIIASLIVPISILVDQKIIGSFDSLLIFIDINEGVKFFLIALNFTLVFTTLATILGLIFSVYSNQIGKLYSINLIGSAVGGVVISILLWVFEPHRTYFLSGLMLALLSILIFINEKKIFQSLKIALLIVSLLLNSYLFFFPFELKTSQFKSISKLKDLPDAKIFQRINSPYGRFEKLSSQFLRVSPGLSLTYTESIPNVNALLINGEIVGYEFVNQNFENEFLKKSTLYLPYSIKDFKKILILNSYGGLEINRALSANAEKIFVTENNPLLFGNLKSQFHKSNRIVVENVDSRIFLEKSEQKFDLIFHPIVESSILNSGLHSVQEKFLFTKEAFQKIYNSLSDDGYFSISCFVENPPRTSLKILNLILSIEVAKNEKVSSKNLVAINNWNVITFVLKKGAFTEGEIQRIKSFCEENQFDYLIGPDNISFQNKYNLVFDENSYQLIYAALNQDVKILDNYLFDIKAPNDNSPYFSNFIKIINLKDYLKQISLQQLTYTEVGYFLLWIVFAILLVLSLALLLIGLLSFKIHRKLKLRAIVYFSLIGFGFMLIEISLIQKFTLILSADIYAITFVICSLLICSGLGSYFSQRLINSELKFLLSFIFVLIFIVTIVFGHLIIPFSQLAAGMNVGLKYIFSFVFILPIGFLLGIPFPSGIKRFSANDENIVPLAWAVNGCFSVIGSLGAVLLLINLGYDITITIAAISYLLCGIFLILVKS